MCPGGRFRAIHRHAAFSDENKRSPALSTFHITVFMCDSVTRDEERRSVFAARNTGEPYGPCGALFGALAAERRRALRPCLVAPHWVEVIR